MKACILYNFIGAHINRYIYIYIYSEHYSLHMVDAKSVTHTAFVGPPKELITETGRKKAGNVCMYCMSSILSDPSLGIVLF